MKDDFSGFMGKNNHPLHSSQNWTKKQQEQVTSKCECKVVKKFALETKKLMHIVCVLHREPINISKTDPNLSYSKSLHFKQKFEWVSFTTCTIKNMNYVAMKIDLQEDLT